VATTTIEHAPDGTAADVRGASVATVQGLYFLVTGVWPLVHVESFLVVTGPKTDLWLVYTVGLLVAVVGLVLLNAVRLRRITPDVVLLACGSSLALAGIDVVFVTRRVIDPIYLADAAAQAVLLGWWAAARRQW
jgi:hypothetical protein